DDGISLGVTVLGDRQDESGHVAAAGRVETMQSFHDVPPVVATLGYDVDFFKRILTYVGEKQASRRAIEGKAPRVAQPECPYLGQSATADERVVRRHAILKPRTGSIHINAHQLPQQRLGILAIAERVALAAAVSQSEIEEAVRTEGQLTGLVVVKVTDLIDGQQNALARGIGLVRIRGQQLILGDYGLDLAAGRSHVIDIELPTLLEVGMKCKPQQAHLSSGDDLAADIEEGLREYRPVLDDPYGPALFNDKEATAAVIGLLQAQWRTET